MGFDHRLDSEYLNLNNNNLYARPEKLYNELKKEGFSKRQIKSYLQEKDVYTLHYPIKKNFPRNKYLVSNIDELWEIDLVDMREYTKFNNNHSFILTVIDVFSKYAYVQPLKNKSAIEVTKALAKIIKESNKIPEKIQSDHGKEFQNAVFKNFLKNKKIKQYVSYSPIIKCAVIERFNRTLKDKIFKYFTHKKTKRYIDVLETIINVYNNSKHSTIRMSPAEVSENDVGKLNELYSDGHRKFSLKYGHNKLKLKEDDLVRVAKPKPNFDRGFLPRWTVEKFRINRIIKKNPFSLFILMDYKNTPIAGRFYEHQLQKVKINNGFPPIEKIIKMRGLGKKLQYYVKFKGEKTNHWINQAELKSQYGVK